MKKFFSVIMLLLVGGLIFVFSSQTYEQQSLIPFLRKTFPGEPFADLLSRLHIQYWGSVITVESKGYYYFLEFLIRKFAHVFLFGVLAVALFSVLVLMKRMRTWIAVFIAFIGAGLYAAGDEYHQLVTGGRTALLEDVLLDMMGAGVALAIYVPIYLVGKKIRRRKK